MALIATCHERAELIIVTGVGLTEQSTSTETNGYSDILSCIGLKRTQEMEVSNTTMATACGRSYWYIPCIQGRFACNLKEKQVVVSCDQGSN